MAEHYNYSLRGARSGPTMLNADDQTIGDLYIELYSRRGQDGVLMPLRQRLEQAPIVCLTDNFDRRVERILQDYVVQQCAAFVATYGPLAGADLFAARLLESLDKLVKRLGGTLHQSLRAAMQRALAVQKDTGNAELHRDWITVLMRQYYDPMYAFQRSNRAARVCFEGDQAAVLAYLREHSAGG